jgi:hypothetical protein
LLFVFRTDDEDDEADITLHPRTVLENKKHEPGFNTTKQVFIYNFT